MVDYLPRFSKVDPSKVLSSLQAHLEKNLKTVEKLLNQHHTYTWDNLMAPLENMEDELHRFWSPISHLNAVMNNEELTAAYQECIPLLSDYGTELGQNRQLYEAIQMIADTDPSIQSDSAKSAVLTHELRDFKLAGVSLPSDQQERFKAVANRKAELTAQYEQNVLDATNAWSKIIPSEKELEGLPDYAMQMLKQDDGYRLSLEYPCYSAVITYANNRELRAQIYHAFVTHAHQIKVPVPENLIICL